MSWFRFSLYLGKTAHFLCQWAVNGHLGRYYNWILAKRAAGNMNVSMPLWCVNLRVLPVYSEELYSWKTCVGDGECGFRTNFWCWWGLPWQRSLCSWPGVWRIQSEVKSAVKPKQKSILVSLFEAPWRRRKGSCCLGVWAEWTWDFFRIQS